MTSFTGGTAYVFQGGSLVVKENCADENAGDEVDVSALEAALAASGGEAWEADRFEVDSNDNSGPVRGLALQGKPAADGKTQALPPGWKALPIRVAVGALSGGGMAQDYGPMGKLLRAYHIVQWRRDSRFCGSCGHENMNAPSGEIARQCPACGRMEFPRISPAVITIITDGGGRALLAHNKRFQGNMYSCVAGFNEAGESLESTVKREIKEEVNVEVEDVRFVRSQPWPFPNSLMVGFTARYLRGEVKPDGVEIEDARWFTRDSLPGLPGGGSVSRYLVNLWLDGAID